MKKIYLLIAVLLVALQGMAQVPLTQGSKNRLLINLGGIQVDSLLKVPMRTPVAWQHMQGGDAKGAIGMSPANNIMYYNNGSKLVPVLDTSVLRRLFPSYTGIDSMIVIAGAGIRRYVDSSIAAIPDIDLTPYAERAYVDSSIAAIPETDLSGYTTLALLDSTKLKLGAYSDSLFGSIEFPKDSVGGTITALPAVGNTIAKTSVAEWIKAAYYPSQNPTANMSITYNGATSNTVTLERMAAGADLSMRLNWTAGRLATTAPLATVVVDYQAQAFSQPPQGGTVSGQKMTSTARNADRTFYCTVTTEDGKTSTVTRNVVFAYKRYWLASSSANPSDATIIAAAGGGSEFSNSRSKIFSVGTAGAQHLVYAYPASYGELASLKIGGFESLTAFTKTTRDLTNASGAVVSHHIYVSNNQFTSTTIADIITQ